MVDVMSLTCQAKRPSFHHLNAFVRQNVITALWSSNDKRDTGGGGKPMDMSYGPHDISDETLAAMVADCEWFVREHANDIALAIKSCPQRNDETGPLGTAGHDFWLTRNSHGCGYLDGDLPKQLGERLTTASERFEEVNLHVGDDGQIYH